MLTNMLYLFRKWNAVLGTILVINLCQVCFVKLGRAKALVCVLTLVELVDEIKGLFAEYKRR